MTEEQSIKVVMFQHENGMTDNRYVVGHGGVTKIEEFMLPALHCDIPHIRVWQGDEKVAEFCRHAIVGIFYSHSKTPDDNPVMW